MNLSILYRGPLASCNYDCPYCPFAKRRDAPAQLRADRVALERFTDWVRRNPDGDRISILFTPWGEGLTRSWYRITVYEARTHRELGSVRLIGENETYPKFKVGNAQIYTTPTDQQLHTALDPHSLTTPP